MHLATDYICPTPRGGRCRVRVYLPAEEQDAPGRRMHAAAHQRGLLEITYAAERLGALVPESVIPRYLTDLGRGYPRLSVGSSIVSISLVTILA